jgi:serine protease
VPHLTADKKRMRTNFRWCLLAALHICLIGVPTVTADEATLEGDGRYLVKFRNDAAASKRLAVAGGRLARAAPGERLAAVYLSARAARLLRNDPNVEYVEIDQRRYPMSQSEPYGIGLVQADDPALSTAGASVGSAVCIIDSGYYLAHEDLQDANVTGTDDPGSGNWYEDSCSHGTHVAGTVSALDNGVGVVGVNGNGLLRVHVEKVFNGSNCAWTYSSDLIAALNRCREAIAGSGEKLVVSMSLAGSLPSAAEEEAFQAAYDAGVLSVAAAGNAGSTATSYPAGYGSVISVAAVDSSGTVAGFSQRNADVELAAPGVNVVSTVPFKVSNLSAGGKIWFGESLQGSARIDAAAPLVNGGLCNSIGDWIGKVVLCQRGSSTFAQKVNNVVAGGGIGAAIYNNTSGGFTGTLNVGSTIPALSLSQADGHAALAHVDADATLVNATGPGDGYQAKDGTSMATPHVSGAAALLWSHYPAKTNAEIREALQVTALDKGAAGKDTAYGFGLVRAKVAYDFLGGIEPPPQPPPPPPPPPADIGLTVTKVKANGKRYAKLKWSGVTGSKVNYYRNATKFTAANDGVQRDGPLALGTYTYRVCKLNTTTCSGTVSITH